jgi:tryptophan synthase beta subunit
VLVNLSGRGDKDTRQVGELEAARSLEAALR